MFDFPNLETKSEDFEFSFKYSIAIVRPYDTSFMICGIKTNECIILFSSGVKVKFVPNLIPYFSSLPFNS